ncbi:TetR family transcriptional regulator [Anderseniella sp. Alg231-50]|uniref:TetR family transcriptional regulator n=1 Tax=Anderseniella sp. Alg231-50 TaxID=1922226 RepID=UPI000D55C703
MSSDNVETRIRILNATWKLLEANQGQGVRMSDIARQAGISRQAVYLHFPTRSELLIATTRYLDDIKGIDARLASSRNTATGVDRLDAFIEAWGNYIPEIHGIAKALLAMKDTDEAAELAWDDRMQAVRHGCVAAINAANNDGSLASDLPVKQATDILWTLLSVRNWEQLTRDCGQSQTQYIETLKRTAHRTLLDGPVRS